MPEAKPRPSDYLRPVILYRGSTQQTPIRTCLGFGMFWNGMQPLAGAGADGQAPGQDAEERIRIGYGHQLRTIDALKKKYDPENLVR